MTCQTCRICWYDWLFPQCAPCSQTVESARVPRAGNTGGGGNQRGGQPDSRTTNTHQDVHADGAECQRSRPGPRPRLGPGSRYWRTRAPAHPRTRRRVDAHLLLLRPHAGGVLSFQLLDFGRLAGAVRLLAVNINQHAGGFCCTLGCGGRGAMERKVTVSSSDSVRVSKSRSCDNDRYHRNSRPATASANVNCHKDWPHQTVVITGTEPEPKHLLDRALHTTATLTRHRTAVHRTRP